VRYRLVIFDFDGTLADSFPWFASVLNGVADRYRFRRVEEHEVAHLRTLGARQIMAHIGLPTWKVPFVAQTLRRMAARDAHAIQLFPGVASLLPELAAHGATLGIVSSNSEALVRRVLGPAAAHVQHYDCGASMFGKRRHLRRILARTGVERTATIYIGDELRDQEAARAERLDFGAVAWGYTSAATLAAAAPSALFADVGDLAARLLARDGARAG
jgi:phosphoglycolate phosphatase